MSIRQHLLEIKLFFFVLMVTLPWGVSFAQASRPTFSYSVSVPNPATHQYRVELRTSGWHQDTIVFKMPDWMPGYYQLMNYADDVISITAKNEKGAAMPVQQKDKQSWQVTGAKNKNFTLTYDIQTKKQFVANSYVDSLHAYIIPANTFLYVEGNINTPVSVRVNNPFAWKHSVSGLELAKGTANMYSAPDFDILYDSPILMGNLEELTPFTINGIKHRFVGYQLGNFDKEHFMNQLKRVVEAGVAIIGDIPYQEYTFIGIGPGRGGIEHLNNTTVSFDGNQLQSEAGTQRMLNFLAHEYFHHYNVKRIRPFELGPFDYARGSKTNLLWVSEGLSVYYEFLMVKRAGVSNDSILFKNFEEQINGLQNNPGRKYQSLVQASFRTWQDGPNGEMGPEKGKTISYYQKGPVVGLLLDFAIRHASQNNKSLDHVMQWLYWEYYKKKNRGFTDAEFQQACETIAGVPLTALFEYVYTTQELDYNTYFNYAGLELKSTENNESEKSYTITRLSNPTLEQKAMLNSWLGL